jgi:alkylation response protein AidB-like acyl-CoA dehydrogenase
MSERFFGRFAPSEFREGEHMTKEATYTKGGEFLLREFQPNEIFTPEDFSETHQMIAKTTEDFIKGEVMPHVKEIDEMRHDINVGLLRKAGELGLLSIDIAEEYGGLGLDKTSSMIVAEKVGPTGAWAVSYGAHAGIGTLPIVYFGTPEQKAKYLPKFATAEWVSSYSLSEPGSGSDALSAKTTAKLSEDKKYYVLNGTKMWLSNAGFADVYITFAQIDGDKFTAFIIEKGYPGVSTAPEEKKLGIKGSSTRQLILENAKVPVENVVGEIGKGHLVAFNILNIGRFKLGASAIGGAKNAINEAVKYADQRKQFGKKLHQFPLIKHKIAEMAIRTFVGDSMVYRTAGMIDNLVGSVDKASPDAPKLVLKSIEEYAAECGMLKVYCSEVLDYVVDEGVQILGGYGYSEEYPMARAYRDARINRIFEGTNEINRLLASGMLVKRASKGELPLFGYAQQLFGELMTPSFDGNGEDELLGAERKLVSNAKKITVLMLGAAAQKYMMTIQDEQEVLAAVTDMMMETYGMESVLLRVLKKAEKSGEAANQIHIDMVRVFVNDAMGRVAQSATNILATIAEGDALRTQLAALKRLTKLTPVNTFALRRKISDAVVEMGGYKL